MSAPKQPKKAKAKKPEPAGDGSVINLVGHPRALQGIRRAKAWGGLFGFLLVGVLSSMAGVPPFEVGLRALAGGVVMWIVCWAVAILAWRAIVEGEVRAEIARRAGGGA